ncbi:MAG: hypothetical protein QXE64_02430, partial [Candidatus Pacearchaeota archaeon]
MRRKWSEKSDDEIIKECVEKGYIGLSPKEIHKKDPGLYQVLRKRDLLDKISKRKIRSWSEKTDDEIIKECEEKGYIGLSPKEIHKKDPSLYRVLRKRDLLDKISKSKKRSWLEKTDDEIIKECEEKGYIGLSPAEIHKKDPGLYRVLRKRDLLDKISKSKKRSWLERTDDEIIKECEEKGYTGLSPKEIKEKDQGV